MGETTCAEVRSVLQEGRNGHFNLPRRVFGGDLESRIRRVVSDPALADSLLIDLRDLASLREQERSLCEVNN